MAWTDGVDRAAGYVVTNTTWNLFLGLAGSLQDLKLHDHSGVAGQGASSLANITFTGQTRFAAGMVGAPSITITGSLTTGIYSPAADQLAVTIAGVQRALLTATALTITGVNLVVTGISLSVGTTPAATGAIRLPNGAANDIRARNAANTADMYLIRADTEDAVLIAANGEHVKLGSTSTLRIGTNPATAGVIRIPNNTAINFRNAANSADVGLVTSNTLNEVLVRSLNDLLVGSGSIQIGATPAATGVIRIPNAQQIASRNVGNTGDVLIVNVDASNRVFLAEGGAPVIIATAAASIGFFGAAPASKPTVTGSRGGNVALADLLTDLATLGLILDSSTA